MFDFPESQDLEELMAKFYETGRVVSTVCHGATGLLNVKLSNGEYLVNGKEVTGFSWPEEGLAGREQAVPFNLEEELKKRGAKYSRAEQPFAPYVRGDGRLITGQNPGSARAGC
jgi:putative intracellular protease/amidase